MNITWVKIESWHAVERYRQHTDFTSLCGRHWDAFDTVLDVADTLGAEKSCENCLRIIGRRADVPEPIAADVVADDAVVEEFNDTDLAAEEPSSPPEPIIEA